MHQEFPKPCEKHNSELFGRKFGNDTTNKIKTKQETKEILTDFARPFFSVPLHQLLLQWYGINTFFILL